MLQVFLLVHVALIMTAWAIKAKPMIDIENNIDSDHNKDASHGDLSEDESNERYDQNLCP